MRSPSMSSAACSMGMPPAPSRRRAAVISVKRADVSVMRSDPPDGRWRNAAPTVAQPGRNWTAPSRVAGSRWLHTPLRATHTAFTRAPHPRRVADPDTGMRLEESRTVKEEDAMSIGRKRRLLIFGSAVCVGMLGVGGYLYAQSLNNRQAFRIAPVTRGPLTAAVTATGTLNAVITVQVGSQVSGQIKEMFVDFNSIVKKNQVIARINPALFEAQVSQAKAQLDAAEAMVLNQQAVIEKTRADLESARAALASAHAQSIKSQVAVVDGKRNLGRQHDLRQRNLIAQADEDAAQVQYDSAVAQYDSSVAQERAQGAALR